VYHPWRPPDLAQLLVRTHNEGRGDGARCYRRRRRRRPASTARQYAPRPACQPGNGIMCPLCGRKVLRHRTWSAPIGTCPRGTTWGVQDPPGTVFPVEIPSFQTKGGLYDDGRGIRWRSHHACGDYWRWLHDPRLRPVQAPAPWPVAASLPNASVRRCSGAARGPCPGPSPDSGRASGASWYVVTVKPRSTRRATRQSDANRAEYRAQPWSSVAPPDLTDPLIW
jgi:hypothetical protein